jgi:hypothetical protein
MAHVYQIQTLVDNTKRSLIKLLGTHDDAVQEGPNTKILAANLYGALDTNGLIASGNANAVYRSSYHLAIKEIYYDIAAPVNAYVLLYWRATGSAANSPIATLGGGKTGSLIFNTDKGGLFLDGTTPANTTGDIGVQTLGFTQNSAYTIALELRKGPIGTQVGRDYDNGQTADPTAFNAGRRSVYGATASGNN